MMQLIIFILGVVFILFVFGRRGHRRRRGTRGGHLPNIKTKFNGTARWTNQPRHTLDRGIPNQKHISQIGSSRFLINRAVNYYLNRMKLQKTVFHPGSSQNCWLRCAEKSKICACSAPKRCGIFEGLLNFSKFWGIFMTSGCLLEHRMQKIQPFQRANIL